MELWIVKGQRMHIARLAIVVAIQICHVGLLGWCVFMLSVRLGRVKSLSVMLHRLGFLSPVAGTHADERLSFAGTGGMRTIYNTPS